MKAIILAGGAGTRLWPMSRTSRPKQFFDVVGQEPLIRDTYRRLLRWFPEEKIYFSISPAFDELLREHFPEIPKERILIEPDKRDTGPAMGYVAALLEGLDPDEPMVFVPSDHFIKDEEVFIDCLKAGDKLIQETGKLVDISIEPLFPSTVLGYTRVGERCQTINGVEIFPFKGHTEKPPYEVAKQYLAEGNYLWHANYYMWTPKKFMEAIDEYSPQMGKTLREIQECVKENAEDAGVRIANLYAKLPKISFDYAVTEKMNCDDMLVLRGDFGWSDIGAWDTLYSCLSTDGYQNVTKGNCEIVDTTGSLIYGPPEKFVAVVGAENLIVVDTGDALLVCRRDRAQQVKDIVQQLRDQGHHHVL